MRIKTGLMVAAFVMLAGCNAPAQHAAVETCKAENQMQQTTLYFGLNRPAGAQITSNEWQQFVDQDVTPRFRDGLTVFDARGQWLGNDGKVAREPSKALMRRVSARSLATSATGACPCARCCNTQAAARWASSSASGTACKVGTPCSPPSMA